MSGSNGPCREQGQKPIVRCRWLPRTSLSFALCLEVIPIELDMIGTLCSMGNVLFLLIVKVALYSRSYLSRC